ncbi:glycosyltransferase [Rhizobium cremeum]|uniref:glycosyltransferase family 2 protein n=1 Tax=Rhizobium cremeum TaxID=2813827 RepID=UPI000DE05BFF|nr:glycosyltransferase family 2 protein [Rhizobium cremeum]MCJ7997682.1 glycosyltransferase [Rhizobium cremeum]MCJ8002776.1 glycosyltransferase [Rhizobium cremeum]
MTYATIHIGKHRDEAASPRQFRLVVGIPSAGRRDILAAVLPHIARQIRLPDEVVICVPSVEDVDQAELAKLPCPVRVLVSRRGSCRQRNHILESIPEADIVVFLDDDFLMAPPYLEQTEEIFAANPDVDICTGRVIADGITGPGISVADGWRMLKDHVRRDNRSPPVETTYTGYGCNMAVRMSAVRIGGLRFDENLPLYGWLEDVDFSRIAARHGRIVSSAGLVGVHLGTKVGRTSGLRFGYSQIANPIYLMRKETMSVRHAGIQMARNLLANVVKIWRPEPWIDRKGRLRGNLLAFSDLLAGRLAPRNIERLE